jgi:hypothetical protein
MREPGRNDMIAVCLLCSHSAHVGEGELEGGGDGGDYRVRSASRLFAIPVPKLKHRDYVRVPPIGRAAKLNTGRRAMRA